MQVKVKRGQIIDSSRGHKRPTWEVSIVLDGVTLFSRRIQKQIPYQPGYADYDGQAPDEAAAKRMVIQMFADKINSH